MIYKKSVQLVFIFLWYFSITSFAQTNKVAILDFENTSGKSEYDALGKSLSNMIITDLQNNIHPKKVEFYERTQLNKLLEEQKLQKSKNFDAKTAVDFGKLSGVNYVFVGAVFVLEGNCNITSKLVDVKTSKILITKEVNGKIESWLSLKSELAETIAKELNSPINLENEYKIVSTSLSTLNQYAKLLTSLDNGDIEKAEELRKIFEETNPEFKYFLDLKYDIEKFKKKVAELENVNSILTNDFEIGDKALTKLDFNNTIKYFEKFIDNPGNQDFLENKKLYVYGKLAFSYFKKGDFENALKNARNANNIYCYYPETNEIELMSLLKLNKNSEAKNKYMVILDSLNFENELSFRRENKNKLLEWKSMDGLFYGLIGKINQDDNQDDEDFWCYRGMPKSGYSSPPKNEFKIKTILKENNIDVNILEQGMSQYLKLEKKLLDLNFPEIFSSDQILNFYKLSDQYAEELYKQKDFNTYKKHLEKEIWRIENFGIPCMEGCARANQRVALSISDKLGKKAAGILYNLGLSNSLQEFYDEFGIIYGKLVFKYLIELIRDNSVTDAAKLYRNILSESIKDRDSYFYNYYWDAILGLRILNEEFDSRFELSKIELEKKLNKKIENQLIKLKIPLANFENTIKVKILFNNGNEDIEVDNIMNSQLEWSKNIGIVKDGNGNKIQLAQKETIWQLTKDSIPAYCYYDFDEKNGEKYGKLYNIHARNLIALHPPSGWRMANFDDYFSLYAPNKNYEKLEYPEISKNKNGAFSLNLGQEAMNISLLKAGQYLGNGFFNIDQESYYWIGSNKDKFIIFHYRNDVNMLWFWKKEDDTSFYSIKLVKNK